MNTVKADDRRRVRLPTIKPGQVFAWTETAEGKITLSPMKAGASEPFPPGSLLKYFTQERDDLETILVQGCVQGPE